MIEEIHWKTKAEFLDYVVDEFRQYTEGFTLFWEEIDKFYGEKFNFSNKIQDNITKAIDKFSLDLKSRLMNNVLLETQYGRKTGAIDLNDLDCQFYVLYEKYVVDRILSAVSEIPNLKIMFAGPDSGVKIIWNVEYDAPVSHGETPPARAKAVP